MNCEKCGAPCDRDACQAVSVKFTFLEMTDDEHEDYCAEHRIDWE